MEQVCYLKIWNCGDHKTMFDLHNGVSYLALRIYQIVLSCRVTDDGVQTRAHLEAQLASSLALKSPTEYRQCLLSYIRFLARCLFNCVYISQCS